ETNKLAPPHNLPQAVGHYRIASKQRSGRAALVISGHFAMREPRPLYRRKRTSAKLVQDNKRMLY
ncbi:MAG: hypothetical protein WBV76_03600, partial [Pseudolabrys sp.]